MDYTVYSHSVNVAMLSMAFGRFMEFSEGQVRSLGLAGMLMEIGLAKIDKRIRNKPDKLNPDEEALIRKHPGYAYDMLRMISSVPYDVLTIVLCHHENMNGSGYPKGLAGDSVPYEARILRVIDTYDALTSPRPYRPAHAPMEAGQILKEQTGGQFDKSVVTSFLRFMGSPYFSG